MDTVNIKKYFYQILSIFAALLLAFSIAQIPVQAAAKPGTVKLSSIKAVNYNKINIKWKKTSGTTNYIVYYKEAGSKKWIKIKTLDNTKSSYTHTSSKKYPIDTGYKYTYTVKAYNKNTKKSGAYNKKGLTTNTVPQTVKLNEAKLNSNGSVTISWFKAGGADQYEVYVRNKDNTKWLSLDTVSGLSCTDKYPFEGQDNIYTVKAYAKSGKTGKYDANGVKVYVPSGDDDDKPNITPVPTFTEEQFAAEIFRLTNVERAKHGEPLVQTNNDLNRAAMQRAKEISIKFSHTRPDGTDALSVFGEYNNIPDNHAAENISAGYTSPQSAVDGWMNSPGHRVSLLNTYSTHLGVGVCKSGSTYYCVQLFTAYGEKEKLTIDANGGYFPTLNNVSVYDMYFYHGTKIKLPSSLPVPVKEGFTFNGWVDDYGIKDASIRIVSAERLHATWK